MFTPHALGSTIYSPLTILLIRLPACEIDHKLRRQFLQLVYPACAGSTFIEQDGFILRKFTRMRGSTSFCHQRYVIRRLPRMRGDRPCMDLLDRSRLLFTPHARGSTRPKTPEGQNQNVYPACAGIDLGKKVRIG